MYVDRTWARNPHPQGPETKQQQQQNTALSCPVSTHFQTEWIQRHTSPTLELTSLYRSIMTELALA